MTETIEVGRWSIRPDAIKTRAIYSGLGPVALGDPDDLSIKNFEAVRERLHAGPLGSLLTQLGIVPPREAFVVECGQVPSGLYSYHGSYLFVGTLNETSSVIPSDDDDLVEVEMAELSPTVSVWFENETVDLPVAFEGMRVVRLRFLAELPWVIGDEHPAEVQARSDELRTARVERVIRVAIGLLVLTPVAVPSVKPLLRWPMAVLAVLAIGFVVAALLPNAWHERRADPGGLFFVTCYLAICIFAVWSLTLGFEVPIR